MSEVMANLEKKISEVNDAISEAEAEVMSSVETTVDEGQTEVRRLIKRLKAWSADAQTSVADAQDSAKSGLASFGDELLHDLKMARAKLP